MRISVWGINYAPELTGIGPYNAALCRFLRERGHEVRMVTRFPYYPQWTKRPEDRGCWSRTDMLDGLRVYRCWHYVPRRVTTLRRILHEASFVVVSFLRQLALSRPDLILVISPPLLLGPAAWLLSRLKRCPYFFHVQDLQPDAAAGLGMVNDGFFLRLLRGMESIAYRYARRVTGISPGMLDAFRAKGLAGDKITLLPNPILRLVRPTTSLGAFRRAHALGPDDFLAVYSGNLGRKQGLDVLLDAAELVRDRRLKILICGEGNQRAALEERLRQRPLENVRLLPLLQEEEYAQLMADCDLTLITQQPGSGRFFLPSKLLASLSFAKPVLCVADEESDLVRLVSEGQIGCNVIPGQPAELAQTLERLANQPQRLRLWSDAARTFAERFRLETVFLQFERLLDPKSP